MRYVSLLALVAMSGCAVAPAVPSPPPVTPAETSVVPSSMNPSATPSPASSPSPIATVAASTSSAPSPTAVPTAAPSSTAASAITTTSVRPPASGSYTYVGRIQVNEALQDPFSNLLLRGVLHDQVVTLDAVGTPDYPVAAGTPNLLVLFGTCKCSLRGQGLRLTIEPASATSAAGGDVRVAGRFRVVRTAADALTLKAA